MPVFNAEVPHLKLPNELDNDRDFVVVLVVAEVAVGGVPAGGDGLRSSYVKKLIKFSR